MIRISIVCCALLTAVPQALAIAASPRVHFDMPYSVACRDVTTPEFAAANPAYKLVEARFDISTLLLSGEERDLSQLLIRIDSPQRTLAVIDYWPKTLHESRHATSIGVSQSDEKSASLGVNLAGQHEVLSQVAANAGLGTKNSSSVKYDLLPPLETVAASGTLLRGAGVFFKLHASGRRPLEGATQFAIVVRVPRDWRVDQVRIHCQATATERSFVSSFDQTVVAGQRDFLVSLYAAGDEDARVQAEQLARQDAHQRLSGRTREGRGQRTKDR